MDDAAIIRQEGVGTLERLGGLAGLVFVVGVVVQNGALLAGSPLPDADLAEVERFYTQAQGRISVAVGLVALNVLMLLLFGSAVANRLDRHPPARVAARAGFGAVVLLCGAFLTTTFLQAVLVAAPDRLAETGQLELIWDLHSAAFTMSATSLGAVLLAFSSGAWLADALVPRWVAVAGFVGSALLVLAGGLVVGSLHGGPGTFLQLAGFATWLLFLVVASVRLVRGSTAGTQRGGG